MHVHARFGAERIYVCVERRRLAAAVASAGSLLESFRGHGF